MTINHSSTPESMTSSNIAISPLSDLRRPDDSIDALPQDPGSEEFYLGEKPLSGKISLHVRYETLSTAGEQTFGFSLPRFPNTSDKSDQFTGLWLAPGEWLILCPLDRLAETCARLDRLLPDENLMMVDVSDRWLQIVIAGQPCFDVLSRGTSVDFDQCLSQPGDCVQTLLGLVPVIIQRTDKSRVIDIYVDRSYAEFLWHWLLNAGSDFELKFIEINPDADWQSANSSGV